MKKTLIILSVIFLFTITWLYQKNQIKVETNSNTTKLKISTSFYPLYFFTQEIVKDKAEVINLTKTGSEPHDFEPSPRDILTIKQSQLLIVNGAFFESWLDKVSQELNQQETRILQVAEKITAIKNQADQYGKEKILDPHIWLDPVLAQQQVVIIKQELQNIDPTNANFYEANSQILIKNLENLHQEFTSQLQNCQNQEIITTHTAFAYLAKRYHFEQIAIQGLNPDGDPSLARIAELSNLARSKNINYIFFETLLSPKIAQTIAEEIGAQTLIFNPLEGLTSEEEENGQDYFTIQRENLNNLSLALNCQS